MKINTEVVWKYLRGATQKDLQRLAGMIGRELQNRSLKRKRQNAPELQEHPEASLSHSQRTRKGILERRKEHWRNILEIQGPTYA